MTTRTDQKPPLAAKRRTRRGPHTRKQILDASLRLFSERGFARTSVRDIAQAAGITDAAIYYHFESKRDLLEALFEERGIIPALVQLETAEMTDPLPEVVGRVAVGALELLEENRDILKVVIVEALGEDPVALEEYTMLVSRWQRALARILQQYAARGELTARDAEGAGWQIVHHVLGAFLDRLMHSDLTPADIEKARERVRGAVQNVVEGIGAPGPAVVA